MQTDEIPKRYINAQELLEDSIQLGLNVVESGYRPDLLIGIWRGGTPVAIAIHEVLAYAGIHCDHMAIRTTSYTGVGQRSNVQVLGLEGLDDKLSRERSVLLVDDVYDTGLSIHEVLLELEKRCPGISAQLRIATPYFKPENNQTRRKPDFFLYETADWLVFPHEIQELSKEELLGEKPGFTALAQRLLALRQP